MGSANCCSWLSPEEAIQSGQVCHQKQMTKMLCVVTTGTQLLCDATRPQGVVACLHRINNALFCLLVCQGNCSVSSVPQNHVRLNNMHFHSSSSAVWTNMTIVLQQVTNEMLQTVMTGGYLLPSRLHKG